MKAKFNPQQAKLQASYAHPGTLYAICYDAEAGGFMVPAAMRRFTRWT